MAKITLFLFSMKTLLTGNVLNKDIMAFASSFPFCTHFYSKDHTNKTSRAIKIVPTLRICFLENDHFPLAFE